MRDVRKQGQGTIHSARRLEVASRSAATLTGILAASRPQSRAADTGQTEERLPTGVPRGACARRERNDRTFKALRTQPDTLANYLAWFFARLVAPSVAGREMPRCFR